MSVRHGRIRLGDRIVPGRVDGEDFLCDSGERVPLAEARLAIPVTPSKVVGIALNYRAHAAEMKKPVPPEPLFFLKPQSALVGPDDAIRLPPDSLDVHHEAELGIVIGTRLSRATVDEARKAVFGLTCVNDVTARDVQRRQAHYTRGKGYDTFCPVGPFVVTGLDPTDLRVTARVNGELKQDGRTNDMITGVYELLAYVSQVMTLEPGDVVATGTPAGVGPIRAGDVVEIEVEGVGVLRNPVVAS